LAPSALALQLQALVLLVLQDSDKKFADAFS